MFKLKKDAYQLKKNQVQLISGNQGKGPDIPIA